MNSLFHGHRKTDRTKTTKKKIEFLVLFVLFVVLVLFKNAPDLFPYH
jgi:hypothetical protein